MTEENKIAEVESVQPEERVSFFSPADILKNFILNWYWFVLSLIIFIGAALLYLRYTTPVYQASAKLLIKGLETTVNTKGLQSLSGSISTFAGFENEVEILRSRMMAEQVVRDLKLNITYKTEGRVKEILLYKNEPITVDMDSASLDTLTRPINLTIKRTGNKYTVTGEVDNKPVNKVITVMPAILPTRVGTIHFSHNGNGMLAVGTKGQQDIVGVVLGPHGRHQRRNGRC